jgi:hypothetical protein
VTVPRVVIDDCPTYDASISMTGVLPPVDVMRFSVPDTDVTVPPADDVIVRVFPTTDVLTAPDPTISNTLAIAEPTPALPSKNKGTSGGRLELCIERIPD